MNCILWVTESHTLPTILPPFSFCPPASSLLLLLSLKHQEIASVKHSFMIQVPVYCENRFTFQIQLENEIHTLT